MSFCNKLHTLIEERNLTQKEMARHLNISPSTLGSYVPGRREPDFATLKAIARYFKVSTDYLLHFPCNNISSLEEMELLRIFRALPRNQQFICIEQCKVLSRANEEGKKEERKLS